MAELGELKQEATAKVATAQEVLIAGGGPAIFANRFYVTLTPAGVRIAFAEQLEGALPAFRTAILLPFQDAIGLAKILGPAPQAYRGGNGRSNSCPTHEHKQWLSYQPGAAENSPPVATHSETTEVAEIGKAVLPPTFSGSNSPARLGLLGSGLHLGHTVRPMKVYGVTDGDLDTLKETHRSASDLIGPQLSSSAYGVDIVVNLFFQSGAPLSDTSKVFLFFVLPACLIGAGLCWRKANVSKNPVTTSPTAFEIRAFTSIQTTKR